MGRQYEGVRQTRDNTIQINFRYKGKRLYETIPIPPTAKNIKIVANKRGEILTAIEEGKFVYKDTFPDSKNADQFDLSCHVTLKTFLKEWIDNSSIYRHSATNKGYNSIVKTHLIPTFGKLKLGEIHWGNVETWQKKSPLAHKTLINIISVLRQALNDAVDEKFDGFDTNPLEGRRIKKKIAIQYIHTADIKSEKDLKNAISNSGESRIKLPALLTSNTNEKLTYMVRSSTEIARAWSKMDGTHATMNSVINDDDVVNPFTAKEIAVIIDNAKKVDPSGQILNYIVFQLFTGLRPSETRALLWSDVDFINETVSVTKALTEVATMPEPPKTNSSRRTIDLWRMKPALQALQNQRDHTVLVNKQIFNNPRTNDLLKDNAFGKTYWRPLLQMSGIKYRKPYQMRHTFASQAISSGEELGWVSATLGHEKKSFTFDTYTKYIPSDNPDAGKKLEKRFANIL